MYELKVAGIGIALGLLTLGLFGTLSAPHAEAEAVHTILPFTVLDATGTGQEQTKGVMIETGSDSGSGAAPGAQVQVVAPQATCTASPDFTYTVSAGATIVPGTTDTGNHCEMCTTVITLPFAVQFYGQTFITATLASNGNMQFLSNSGAYGDYCPPWSPFNYAIVPYGAYLNTEAGGIYTSVSGIAPNRIFNVEWRACVHDPITYNCDQQVDFEVRLYENSPTEQIDFVYGQVDSSGGGPAIVDLQQDTGSHYTGYSCYDWGVLSPGTLITFTRDTCAPPTATPTGTPPTATNTPTPTLTPTATPTLDPCHIVGAWATEPALSIARSHPVGAVVNNQLYVIGGSNSNDEPPYIATVERFDPGTESWSTVAPIPTPAENMGAAVVDNKIYVAGGYTVRGGFILDTMQVYDTSNNSWTLASPMPAERFAAGVTAYNGKVYIMGGTGGGVNNNSVFEYDPATDTYTTKSPMPVTGDGFSAVALGNLIYVVGGYGCLYGNCTALHYVYNPTTDSWSSIAPVPAQAFTDGGGFALNGEIWMVAGVGYGGGPYPPNQQVLIYSPVQNSWRYGPTMNTPRFWTSAVGVINGRAYVASGIDSNTPSPPYNYLTSVESISYEPCGTITVTPTRTPTVTGTPPTLTPTETGTSTPTPTATACGFPTQWDSEAPMSLPRSFAGGAVVNGQLYVLGGYTGGNTYTPAVERYDPVAHSWTMLASMPITLTGEVQAAAVGTKIYVPGSLDVPNIQIYDTATNTWSLGAALPAPRTAPGVAAYDGKVYIIGGQDSYNFTNTVFEYDPATDAFTTKAPMPGSDSNFAAVTVGNLIYALGGVLNLTHYVYNPVANTWSSINRAAGDGLYGAAAFTLNGEIWVEGGTDDAPPPPDQEIQIYNPATRTWRFGPSFNTPRHWSSAVGVIGNRAYVAGGVADANGSNLASVESIAYASCGPTPTGTPPTATSTATPNATVTVCGEYNILASTSTVVPGTVDIGNHCLDCITAIQLPFAFSLYDYTYNYVDVDSKGNLQFLNPQPSGDNTCLPYIVHSYTISALWDNYRTDLSGTGIYTSVTGTAPDRIFNIEWRAELIDTGELVDFEARLYENSPEQRFDVVYGDTGSRQGSGATVGVQKNEVDYTQFECGTGIVTNGLVLTFFEPLCEPTGTPTPGAETETATPTGVASSPTTTALATSTATATATPTTAAGMPFRDVHPTDYFYAPVQALYSMGVISGYPDGTFRPYANTTRGQVMKIFVLTEGWSIDTTGGPHFSDVPIDSTFYAYIETAHNHGVISGYPDGTFRPGAKVTRGQVAKVLVGSCGWAIDTTGGPHFTDVPISNPFYAYIETAYHHNVISGYPDGTFRPGDNATRGQISKIAYGAMLVR